MSTGLILLGVVVASAAITYGHAAHDVAAARRFRGLTRALHTPTDRLRNRRWHTAGWALRATATVLIGAVAGLVVGRWSAGLLATAVAGAVSAALFDVKFGLAWNYLGATSAADLLARARLAGLVPVLTDAGAVMLVLEVALVVVCGGAFLVWA